MKPLAAAVSRPKLELELRERVPVTKFRGLHVFSFWGSECPHSMREVGRLREKVFRAAGAGRGQEIDVDTLDFQENAYQQLVAVDPESFEFVAMVRFQRGGATTSVARLRTASLFDYSNVFRHQILPRGVELGRSVVNDDAQRARVGLFALWRGLAALAVGDEPFDYFFGNVTIYEGYPKEARDLLVATVEDMYRPPKPLFFAREGLRLSPEVAPRLPIHPLDSARDGVAHLQHLLASYGARLPSILQSYLSLSTEVWCGETAHDRDFGDAHEMAIVVPIESMELRAKMLFGFV